MHLRLVLLLLCCVTARLFRCRANDQHAAGLLAQDEDLRGPVHTRGKAAQGCSVAMSAEAWCWVRSPNTQCHTSHSVSTLANHSNRCIASLEKQTRTSLMVTCESHHVTVHVGRAGCMSHASTYLKTAQGTSKDFGLTAGSLHGQ